MKLFDFDTMFENKISQFIRENRQGYTAEQWEDLIPELYRKFGDTEIKGLGTTPKGYYLAMDAETLVATLQEHVRQNVPVPDFLLQEMSSKDCCDALLKRLPDAEGEFLSHAISLIGWDERAVPTYFALLEKGKLPDSVKEEICELCRDHADRCAEQALALYRKGMHDSYVLEILARSGTGESGDSEVYPILLGEFLAHPAETFYVSLLALYGDKRALPYLEEQIEQTTRYADFCELKYAIEALGGSYQKERDFSPDPTYRKIHQANSFDLFAANKKA